MLDRVTGGRGDKALKYSMTSVVAVVCTQTMLVLFHGVFEWPGVASNIMAVSLSAVPAFLLNKHWVWERTGPADMRREILPFWAFTLAGLVLSTVAVALIDRWTDSTVAVSAANIGAFGLLWVAKFLFLDEVMFRDFDHDGVTDPA